MFPGAGKTCHLVEVKGAWRRLCRKAGLSEVTIHDLRRTLGSRMAIAGVNLPTIGRVLGHVNLNATQIYARFDIEAARLTLETSAKPAFIFACSQDLKAGPGDCPFMATAGHPPA